MRRDDSPSGGDLGQLSERTTQLLMRFGMPLCHDLYSDNGTCANLPADLGRTLRYSPASAAVSWSYDDLLPEVSLNYARRQGL